MSHIMTPHREEEKAREEYRRRAAGINSSMNNQTYLFQQHAGNGRSMVASTDSFVPYRSQHRSHVASAADTMRLPSLPIPDNSDYGFSNIAVTESKDFGDWDEYRNER